MKTDAWLPRVEVDAKGAACFAYFSRMQSQEQFVNSPSAMMTSRGSCSKVRSTKGTALMVSGR